MRNPKVFISRLSDGYLRSVRSGLSFVSPGEVLRAGHRVFIKPNLTYPEYREGVMTSPECLEALIVALKDYGVEIIVGEADGGGYNRFLMDEVFERTGLCAMAKRYGVRLVNLSKLPSRELPFEYKGKRFGIPLPEFLLDEVGCFITVPVPKVHANTGVSISIKNQWGCIQEPSFRLKLHPYFKAVIQAINKALRVRISVVDGRFGLNRNGPMRGDPVELGWVLVSDNILAADVVCCTLMGLDPRDIGYLRFHLESEPLPPLDAFHFNQDYHPFIGPQFYLHRDILDYPGYFAFRSPTLAYLAYHSPLSRILHKGLYLFREKFYDHD